MFKLGWVWIYACLVQLSAQPSVCSCIWTAQVQETLLFIIKSTKDLLFIIMSLRKISFQSVMSLNTLQTWYLRTRPARPAASGSHFIKQRSNMLYLFVTWLINEHEVRLLLWASPWLSGVTRGRVGAGSAGGAGSVTAAGYQLSVSGSHFE